MASNHKECTNRPKKVASAAAAYDDLVTYARKRDNDRSISPFSSEDQMRLDAKYLTLTPESPSSCSTRSRSSSIESNPIGSTATSTKFTSSSAYYEDLVTIACCSPSSKSDFGSNKLCLRNKSVENHSLCSGSDSDKQTLSRAVASSITSSTEYRALNKSVVKILTLQKSLNGCNSTAIVESMPTINRRVLYVDGGALPCPHYVWKNKIKQLNASKPLRILSIMKKNRYGILEH